MIKFDFSEYKIPIIDNGVRLPEFKPSLEQYKELGIFSNVSNYDFLVKLCHNGLNKISNQIDIKEKEKYYERCEEELSLINELGFTDYILIVWDICDYGNKNNIPRGPARGSVASSLVCYLIGITEIDSVKAKTFFTRFINKSRAKYKIIDGIKYIEGSLLPDIDQDQDYFRRSEIINYINNKYKNKTSKLLTLTSFSSKILIKDVLKIFEESTEEEANYASDLLEKIYGIPQEISDALKNNKEFIEWSDSHRESCDIACKLFGLYRSKSVHASAILIAHDNIENLIPLELSSNGDNREVVSGYDMYNIQDILLKIDELGLKTVSLIDRCCKLINIKPSDIDINHPSIYEFLQNFEYPYGIFQLESHAQYNVAKKIKPKNFKQIVDALAISRPGASSFLGQYLDYIHNGAFISTHPIVDEILKETGGICLFQESLLKILNKLGMELSDCESLRKAIGKKIPEEIQTYKQKIYDICKKNNHPSNVADLIWQIAEDSGGYQFNLAHAFSYATLTARTCYLKTNYPKEFFLSLLKMSKEESDSQEIINKIKQESQYFNIEIKPPHILRSEIDFSIQDGDIYFGLGGIKGISEKSISKLNDFKNKYSNKFEIFSAADQAKIPQNIMGSLIYCGSLDDMLTETRSKTFLEFVLWNLLTDKEKNKCLELGESFKFDLIKLIKALNKEIKNEKGKTIIRDSRYFTIKKYFDPYIEIYKHNSKNEALCKYIMEKTLLGFSYTSTLIDLYKSHCPDLITIQNTKQLLKNDRFHVVCEVVEFKEGISKAKNKYWKILGSDHTGRTEFLLANSPNHAKLQESIENNDGDKPEINDIVIMRGTKGDDILFAKTCSIQQTKIFKKISELEIKQNE